MTLQQFALQLSYSSSDRQWPCGSTTIELVVNPIER